MSYVVKSYRARFELSDDDTDGTFVGHVSAWGDDLDGDTMAEGSFAKTIADHRGRFPMLYQHRHDAPIGVSVEMAEDEKGLAVKGEFNLNVQLAREAHSLLKQGALQGFSVGFRPVKFETKRGGGLRFTENALREFSVVTFPAQPLATVAGMKAERVLREAEALLHEKAGRRLSKDTRSAIEQAVEGLRALLDADEADDGSDGEGAAKQHAEPATEVATLRAFLTEIRDGR